MERIELDGTTSTTLVIDDEHHTVKRVHPFRGLFWGLVFGVGLAGVLVFSATITLSVLAVVAYVVVGLVVGVVWGVVGPARKPKGPPPSTRVVVEQLPTSRFDDFGTSAGSPSGPPSTLGVGGTSDTVAGMAPPDPSTVQGPPPSGEARPT